MSQTETEIVTFYPRTQLQWRKWLEKHHSTKFSVWLIYYRKDSGKASITWSEAVDEALCFGWVDSKKKTIDDEKYMQFFSRRKTTSNWSKINKAKIEQLIASEKMTEAGLVCVEVAKKNGSWTTLDQIEELEIPKDLEKEFKKHRGAKAFFTSLSKSAQKLNLYMIASAKRPETRQKRVEQIADLAGKKIKM